MSLLPVIESGEQESEVLLLVVDVGVDHVLFVFLSLFLLLFLLKRADSFAYLAERGRQVGILRHDFALSLVAVWLKLLEVD